MTLNENEIFSYTSEKKFACAVLSYQEIQIGNSYSIKIGRNSVAQYTVTSALMTEETVSFGGGDSNPGGGNTNT